MVHCDRLLWESIKQYEGTDPIEPWLRCVRIGEPTHALCQRRELPLSIFAPKLRTASMDDTDSMHTCLSTYMCVCMYTY